MRAQSERVECGTITSNMAFCNGVRVFRISSAVHKLKQTHHCVLSISSATTCVGGRGDQSRGRLPSKRTHNHLLPHSSLLETEAWQWVATLRGLCDEVQSKGTSRKTRALARRQQRCARKRPYLLRHIIDDGTTSKGLPHNYKSRRARPRASHGENDTWRTSTPRPAARHINTGDKQRHADVASSLIICASNGV